MKEELMKKIIEALSKVVGASGKVVIENMGEGESEYKLDCNCAGCQTINEIDKLVEVEIAQKSEAYRQVEGYVADFRHDIEKLVEIKLYTGDAIKKTKTDVKNLINAYTKARIVLNLVEKEINRIKGERK